MARRCAACCSSKLLHTVHCPIVPKILREVPLRALQDHAFYRLAALTLRDVESFILRSRAPQEDILKAMLALQVRAWLVI